MLRNDSSLRYAVSVLDNIPDTDFDIFIEPHSDNKHLGLLLTRYDKQLTRAVFVGEDRSKHSYICVAQGYRDPDLVLPAFVYYVPEDYITVAESIVKYLDMGKV